MCVPVLTTICLKILVPAPHSVYSPDAAMRRMYTRFGYFVEGVDHFDSAAFRLSYMEATAMDPASRILLEQTQVRSSAKWLECNGLD